MSSPPPSHSELVDELDELLRRMEAAGDAVDPDGLAERHRAGALNLARYLELRHADRRSLQEGLLEAGASPLVGCEVDVLESVRSARAAVGALAGGDPTVHTVPERTARLRDLGERELDENAAALLGPEDSQRGGRIMVTLPSEAATDPGLVLAFAEKGMDLARINCAHDDPDAWLAMIRHVQDAAASVERTILVSMDLAGPKIRTGPIEPGPPVDRARVTRGPDGRVLEPARIWFTAAPDPEGNTPDRTAAPDPEGNTPPPPQPPPPPGRPGRPVLELRVDPGWLAARRPGDVIDIPDTRRGTRAFEVVEAGPEGVLAECDRNLWVRDGALVSCLSDRARLHGIPEARQRIRVHPGDEILLDTDLTPIAPPRPGELIRLGCAVPEAVEALEVGDPVLFDDGAISTVVEETSRAAGDGDAGGPWVRLTVISCPEGGKWLGAEKGINTPGTTLAIPALTDEDRENLDFAAEHADIVALSFARTPEDVAEAVDEVRAAGERSGRRLGLLVKIETRQSYRALPRLLWEGMRHDDFGIMIARGDLAVEMGFEAISEVPKNILALCQAARVPAVLATQVLERLAKTGLPSRAEISDAASAQRAECVMLNKGRYTDVAIETLDGILLRMEKVQRKALPLLSHVRSWD